MKTAQNWSNQHGAGAGSDEVDGHRSERHATRVDKRISGLLRLRSLATLSSACRRSVPRSCAAMDRVGPRGPRSGGSDSDSTLAAILARHRCSVYVLSPHGRLGEELNDASTRHQQYSAHWWLQRSLQEHPWRVDRLSSADIVYFNASLTHRHKDRYAAWRQLKEFAWQQSNASSLHRPAFFATAFVPFDRPRNPDWSAEQRQSARLYLLSHFVPPGADNVDVVAPQVVSEPDWFVGARLGSSRSGHKGDLPLTLVPWARRKLFLYVAGHVPPIYLSSVRWTMWRLLKDDPRATVLQSDLIRHWRYATCDTSRFATRAAVCDHICGLDCSQGDAGACQACRGALMHNATAQRCGPWDGARFSMTFGQAGAQICPTVVPYEDYLALGMAHRFCLVAPGDDPTSKKIHESIAFAALGGCIPVFIRTKFPHSSVLPFTGLLNYCTVAYVVWSAETKSNSSLAGLLRRLESVSEGEAQQRWRAAAAMRDAHVYREQSSLGLPSAAEFALAAMCQRERAARLLAAPSAGGPTRSHIARLIHASVTPDICAP